MSTICGASLFVVLPAVALLHAAPVLAAGVVGTGAQRCSEAALDAALVGGGIVTFDCGPHRVTITITSTKTIAADTTIDGGGLITISGGNSVGVTGGVFLVNAGVNFTVQSLTIANGFAHVGGGILNYGTLMVTNSTFSGNGALSGGGIVNDGRLTVANSTFSDNGAAYGHGAISNSGMLTVTNSAFSGNSAGIGGGIGNSGTLTVTNSTFYDNRTGGGFPFSDDGGGIVNGGTLTVTNSTFSRNSAAGRGGGIASLSGAVTITNTIIANSTAGGNCFYESVATDGGHNIDDGTTCGFTGAGCASTGGSSFCNTNPQFDPAGLAENGGPTQTIALLAGSPAIDAGDESVCAAAPVNNLDQRGYIRPGEGATSCSIGAYEANAGTASCPPFPASGCVSSGRSLVLIEESANDTKDKLLWKWIKGGALTQMDLADPTSSASYALCVYAGTVNPLIADAELPPGPSWTPIGDKGYKFKGTSPDGLTLALLKSGAAGKSKALARGKGAALPDLTLPLTYPVTVQLKKGGSPLCLESTFTSVNEKKNTDTQFKAKQ